MPILIVGDVYVEVHQGQRESERLVRLGGVFHAARALHALGQAFALACNIPSYLESAVRREARELGCCSVQLIGEVQNAPNVVFVQDPRETRHQGYDVILRDERKTAFDDAALRAALASDGIEDVLLFPFPGVQSPVLRVLAESSVRVHVDVHYDVPNIDVLRTLGRPFDTVFCSTSADLFRHLWEGHPDAMRAELIPAIARQAVLKENRGGSRLFTSRDGAPAAAAPAHLNETIHSVGVGDCFDAVFLDRSSRMDARPALAYASYIAGQYATTWDTRLFCEQARRALNIPADEIASLDGISLPWEDRPRFPIYMAAPDFDDVDREPLERIVDSLRYHNFQVRLPVRENGLSKPEDSLERKDQVFQADMDLLDICDVLVAVLLYNDPGTLLEVGLATAMHKPTIVYDPYRQATNLMLSRLPRVVSCEEDVILRAVYDAVSSLRAASMGGDS